MEIHAPGVIHVVSLGRERLHQPYILIEPVAILVVFPSAPESAIVVAAVAQEHANGLLLGGQHAIGIHLPAAQIHKAADIAQHLAKFVGPLPRHHERRDRPRARPADAVLFGILRNVVVLVQHRHQLVHNDARVFVVGRVVFRGTIGGAVAPFRKVRLGLVGAPAGIDEDPDHHRNLAPVDEVVHHVLRMHVAGLVLESLPVLENHQAGRHSGIVLRGHVYPIGVLRARIDIARQRERPADLAFRHARLRHGIGPQTILRIPIGSGRHGRLLGRRCRGLRGTLRHRGQGSSHQAGGYRESDRGFHRGFLSCPFEILSCPITKSPARFAARMRPQY